MRTVYKCFIRGHFTARGLCVHTSLGDISFSCPQACHNFFPPVGFRVIFRLSNMIISCVRQEESYDKGGPPHQGRDIGGPSCQCKGCSKTPAMPLLAEDSGTDIVMNHTCCLESRWPQRHFITFISLNIQYKNA